MSIIRGALRYMTVVMMRNLPQRLTNNGAVSEKMPPARPEIVKMIPNAPGKEKETQDEVELNQRNHSSLTHCEQKIWDQQLREERYWPFLPGR